MSRAALDRLELANCQASYASALTHAVMHIVEDIHDLISPGGATPNSNVAAFTSRAITLLCLQIEQNERVEAGIDASVIAWPLATVAA